MGRAELARELYRTQLRIRRFEETVSKLFAAGRLPGFVHLSLGQEAVAAGACAALHPEDVIASTHRGHGHCLAKGGDPRRMLAELFGGRDGYCAGLGGSMHIADLDRGILGANGIVGAGILIATGAAYSFQVQHVGRVAVAFFGDGAINEGSFHEGLNLAALWRLPAVYVCEHNGFAELTPESLHAAGPGLAARGAAYGIETEEVDGIDALAVHDAVAAAAARCRAGVGPALLLAWTNLLRRPGSDVTLATLGGVRAGGRGRGRRRAWAAEHAKGLRAVRRVAPPRSPVPFTPSLEAAYFPSAERIRDACLEVSRV